MEERKEESRRKGGPRWGKNESAEKKDWEGKEIREEMEEGGERRGG